MKTEWELSQLCDGSEEAIDRGFAATLASVTEFEAKWRNLECWTSPELLAESIADYNRVEEAGSNWGRIGRYATLRFVANRNNPDAQALYQRAVQFATTQQNKIQFYPIDIGRVPAETREEWLVHPLLHPYATWLKKQWALAEILLGEEAENLWNDMHIPGFDRWVDMLNEVMAGHKVRALGNDGKVKSRNYPGLDGLLYSPSERVRQSAGDAIGRFQKHFRPYAVHQMNALLHGRQIDDKVRRLPYPSSERLRVHDDIGEATVTTMIAAVRESYHVSNRFYDLKARLIGLDDSFTYFDRNAPVGQTGWTLGYGDAMALVQETLAQLHPAFGPIVAGFTNEGRIDAFPRDGKAAGAVCYEAGKAWPSFIMLNFTGSPKNVIDLAHELGHGIHNTIVREKQPGLYQAASTGVAETASTFTEDYVFAEVLRGISDPETRLMLMMLKLDGDIATVFRQTAAWEFEMALHREFREKCNLAAEDFDRLFLQEMSAYLGPSVAMVPGAEGQWVTWGHFRNNLPGYVYSYVFGRMLAMVFQARVQQDPSAIEDFYRFLAAGTSLGTEELAASVGIDITNPEVWRSGVGVIEQQIDQAEQLARQLGKIK